MAEVDEVFSNGTLMLWVGSELESPLYSSMLANMVQKRSVKQQVSLCTRVNGLLGGLPKTENQMWLSVKSFFVFDQNKCAKSVSSSLVAVGIILSI